jgi:uncharacterized alkaline shock family protein YloU
MGQMSQQPTTPQTFDHGTSTTMSDPLGNVRITKHVLASIIELAVLGIEGVAKLAPISSPWPRFITRVQPQRGLAINVHHHVVAVDIYLIMKPGVNMVQVGRSVQDAVATAIEDLLGMTAGAINVYIQDVA